jgi:hypothetical protein
MIKQIFYTGFNDIFVTPLRRGRKEKLKTIKFSSEIKDHSHFYEIWFEFVNLENQKFSSEKRTIDCSKICDDRGYVQKDLVIEKLMEILTQEVTKII